MAGFIADTFIAVRTKCVTVIVVIEFKSKPLMSGVMKAVYMVTVFEISLLYIVRISLICVITIRIIINKDLLLRKDLDCVQGETQVRIFNKQMWNVQTKINSAVY